MFTKISSTSFPPEEKPMMVFDGNCGFCKYWVIKWKKISGTGVDYKPYQKVAEQFRDIDRIHFKEAVRYISLDGTVYSGPEAAYITYYNKNKVRFLYEWYKNKKWFAIFSDKVYQWVADHRNLMSKVSIRLFGKNPANPKPYWKFYLLGVVVLLLAAIFLV